MNEPGKNGSRDEQTMLLEQQLAQAQWENSRWVLDNQDRLLHDHPEFYGKFAAVASRHCAPLLAVAETDEAAYKKALDSEELRQLAEKEKLPVDFLFSVVSLD